MVCLSVILLCYRMTCLLFYNKRFCNKKQHYVCRTLYMFSWKQARTSPEKFAITPLYLLRLQDNNKSHLEMRHFLISSLRENLSSVGNISEAARQEHRNDRHQLPEGTKQPSITVFSQFLTLPSSLWPLQAPPPPKACSYIPKDPLPHLFRGCLQISAWVLGVSSCF